MQIQDPSKSQLTLISSLKPGELFRIGDLFMVTSDSTNGSYTCVTLKDGYVTSFPGRLVVQKVEAELVVKD